MKRRIGAVVAALTLSLCGGGQAFAKDARSGGSRWGANYFPNIPLTTHEGESVRFFDDLIKDKVVVINFIYTSCTESCPLETAALARVRHMLGDRVGDDVFIYSISIDPEVDTPEVLNAYAKKFRAGPGWLFLTGKEEHITLLRRKFGLLIEEIQDGNNDDHNLTIILGNQSTGQWIKRSPFEDPNFLVEQIGGWLHSWKKKTLVNSYADAPKLRPESEGAKLFRHRCSVCHSIGDGDIFGSERELLGPDLLGVTRKRDPVWLARWITDPQKMLDERDPIALEIYAAYDKLTMPNFYFDPDEVDFLIDYIAAESRRFESAQRTQAP